MLGPSELAAGMGFPSGYPLRGTLDQQRRMIGNVVAPPVARDVLTVVADALSVNTAA